MWTARATLSLLASLLAIGAVVVCPDLSDAATTPSAPQDAIHQVMPGDDLHLIAGYYYGDARQWERIWHANRDQIRNPNRIERGALLRVPETAAPAQPYPDFVARARPALPGTREAATPGPTQAGGPPAPDVEVRIMGEPVPRAAPGSVPGSGAPRETSTATPEASAPPRVVGASGTLPPRPIQVPQPGRTGQEGR